MTGKCSVRQMQRVEGLDPSLPIKPPPLPVWKWLRDNIMLICAAIATVLLIEDLTDPQPIRVKAVFFIALDVSSIFFALTMHATFLVLRILHDGGGRALGEGVGSLAHTARDIVSTLKDTLPPCGKGS